MYEKFVDDIYTPGNYGNIYIPTVSIKEITYNDANIYWKNHCAKHTTISYIASLFYSIVSFIVIVGVFCISVIISMTMNLAYFYKQKHRYAGTKNE
jgi:hypothetical protein